MKILNFYLKFFVGIIFSILLINSSFGQNSTLIKINLKNRPNDVKSKAGFLSFSNLYLLNKNIDELKPGFWRVGGAVFKPLPNTVEKNNIDYLTKKGITPIVVVSDLIAEQNKQKNWRLASRNVENIPNVVERLYSNFNTKIIYDIWNEPNQKSQWHGSYKDFFVLYKKVYDAIRSMPNGDHALITGPSTAYAAPDGFDTSFISSFLSFCDSNKMKIDILNWHENGDEQRAFLMKEHINFAYKEWIKKYPNVGIKQVYITEIVGSKNQYNPLTTLTYLYILDNSRATGGCKACWDQNCNNNTMNGIITPDGRPRSIWWTYKFYAESLTNRLSFTPKSDKFPKIAYLSNNKDTLNILMGNVSAPKVRITILLQNLKSIIPNNFFHYTLFQIPNTDSNVLNAPLFIESQMAPIRANTSITFNNIDNNSVYLLKVYK